jgi:multidrug efflux pump subunit AcrA (membrane-fusion protein)
VLGGAKHLWFAMEKTHACFAHTRPGLFSTLGKEGPLEKHTAIFRQEALEYRARGSHTPGDLLRIAPGWTNPLYWSLVGLLVAGLTYAGFERASEYAKGSAIIRDEGRSIVTASVGGTVAYIAVKSGQSVEMHEPLLWLDDLQPRANLERLNRDLEAQRVNWLENPNDANVAERLATLRTEISTAETQLKARTIVAPRAGLVRDIRIRAGQLVAPGELILTIVGENDSLSLFIIFPGQYRPLLKKNSPLRLELKGFRNSYQQLTIDSVGRELVGPNEVRRFLGQDVGDALELGGLSVIVQARLPMRGFKADGRWQEYHDGMQGTAEARVGSERLLVALVPGLKQIVRGTDE